MELKEFTVITHRRTEFIDITDQIEKIISSVNIKSGICCIFVPHTTAGVTINENADRNVSEDIRTELDKIVPFDDDYMHDEGNSPAHIKSSIIGPSLVAVIENGKIKLGTWQGVYFCEFDGPRTRRVWVKIIEGA